MEKHLEKMVEEEINKIATLDERGREIPAGKPLYIDVGTRPLSIRDQIKRLMREEVSRYASASGYDSFEEADDFEVGDDFDDDEKVSEYQVMAEETPKPRPRVEPPKPDAKVMPKAGTNVAKGKKPVKPVQPQDEDESVGDEA